METTITEEFIVKRIVDFMINKKNGNWHEEKVDTKINHKHGVDIKLVGGKRNSEYFYIECKGKSKAKSEKTADIINKECWINALGQIITRMKVKRIIKSKDSLRINTAYKYGLGLYWVTAKVALRRIPKEIAKVLCLHIFAVNDKGDVKYFTPSEFGIYEDDYFTN